MLFFWGDKAWYIDGIYITFVLIVLLFKRLIMNFYPTAVKVDLPEFPLIPASKGFCITLRKTLKQFNSILESVGVSFDSIPDPAEGKAALTPSETQASAAPPALTNPENAAGHNS